MTNSSMLAEAEKVYQVLIKGRIVEREAAQRRLTAADPTIDRERLRRLIIEGLDGPFSVSNASKDSKSTKAWARCWLLSALGRTVDEDTQAAEYVRRYTSIDHEPNYWARYWALESLVVARPADLVTLARTIVSADDEKLVQKLAAAILAEAGDEEALGDILASAKEQDWATLRALRVVPLEDAVRPMCEIVASPRLSDATYDSIVALGAVPPEWSAAEEAANALTSCIRECRKHPWWDAMRAKALAALNNLGSPDVVPLLVTELSDSNPTIVYEAARALERIVGVRKATARIVEAASQTGAEAIQQYANALRWMNRDEIAEELESLMLSGAVDQQEIARALLSDMGGRAAYEKLRSRADTMKQHLDVLEKTEEGIRKLFDDSLDEARSGYKLGTWMNTAVFVLGIGFVGLAGVFVAQGKEALAGLTGTGGALAILYNLFLADPRRRVQESVEHLMSLKIIFLGYLRQLHQADKAYVRRFLDDDKLTPAEVKQFSDVIAATMRDAVLQIRQGAAAPARKRRNRPAEGDAGQAKEPGTSG